MASSNPIRVAVVGAGDIARQAHLPAWATRTDARVDVLVDRNIERARGMAQEFGVPRVESSLGAVSEQVDAVDLCVPPDLHCTLTLEALEAGLHVLVEKPVATDPRDAVRMQRAAERADRTVMVAENWLFSSARRIAERTIDDLGLGRPFLVKAWHESALYIAEEGLVPAWTFSAESAGAGYLMQAGIHTFSLLEAMLGPVERITAATDRAAPPGKAPMDSTTVVSAELAGDTLASVVLTGRSRQAGPRRLGFQFFFPAGVVEFDVWSGAVSYTLEGRQQVVETGSSSMGFREEVDHFLYCVATGTQPESSVPRLRRTLETVLAAYEAAATGRWLQVDQYAEELITEEPA
ncbi:Gfo/Idh/MocA family protein [Blastococcus deserti]|uniref:Gfo/Idh/MocA family protein n=1 Tax=Blastococcus deserti TaxID=2259033 RepID=A0ABW4XD24_9ACTN